MYNTVSTMGDSKASWKYMPRFLVGLEKYRMVMLKIFSKVSLLNSKN